MSAGTGAPRSHAWSATPTKDLVWHVLGVTPAEPGYAAVQVAPRPGTLAHIAGSVPTPYGHVRVDVKDGQVRVDSPIPVRFVPLTGEVITADAGRDTFRL